MVVTTAGDQGEAWGLWRLRGAPRLTWGVREFGPGLPATEQMYLGSPGKMTRTQGQVTRAPPAALCRSWSESLAKEQKERECRVHTQGPAMFNIIQFLR